MGEPPASAENGQRQFPKRAGSIDLAEAPGIATIRAAAKRERSGHQQYSSLCRTSTNQGCVWLRSKGSSYSVPSGDT